MQIVHQRRLLLVILILIAILLIVIGLVQADRPTLVSELDLNGDQNAEAYELFRDENGHLWISEFGAGEIWHVDPENEEYTIYSNLTGASDAKVDANGNLWWSDYDNNNLGHLKLGSTVADIWSLTTTLSGTLGLAIDPLGHIWSTHEKEPTVHRLSPDAGELCAYTVPDGGASSYIVADSGRIWLGDWINNRILALDPVENEFEIWHLPNSEDANLFGLAVDENHDIWWADRSLNYLGRLTPGHNQVTTYTLPLQTWFAPTIVSTGHGKVWTTSGSIEYIARLNPEKVYVQPTSVFSTTADGTPVCHESVSSKNLPINVGDPVPFEWGSSGAFYNQITSPDSDVWLVYKIGYLDVMVGRPWGIVAAGQDVFIVDQARQKLTRLKPCYQLTLTGIGNGEDPSGSPDPSGICPEGEYLSGEVVTLTARPAVDYSVLSWRNSDDDSSKGLTNSITMPLEKHTVFVKYGQYEPGTFLPLILRY